LIRFELDKKFKKLVTVGVVSFVQVKPRNWTHELHDYTNECNMIVLENDIIGLYGYNSLDSRKEWCLIHVNYFDSFDLAYNNTI
jgi:hypothetical protein